MIPTFEVMKNNLSFRFYSTCTLVLVFWLPTLDKFHSLLSMNGKLMTQYCPGVIFKNEFLLLLSHEIALKRVFWINLQGRKRTECVKLPLGTLA